MAQELLPRRFTFSCFRHILCIGINVFADNYGVLLCTNEEITQQADFVMAFN